MENKVAKPFDKVFMEHWRSTPILHEPDKRIEFVINPIDRTIMKVKRIADIGEVHWHNRQPYFLFGHSDNGFIFKDCEAYKDDWDAPCYVPEYAGEDAAVTIDGVEYECGGEDSGFYTHNDLLKLCCGNREWCDALFSLLDWCYPETKLEEMDDEDTAYYYRFIKQGAKVWWHDPAGEASGEYEVYRVPFSFDEHGELTGNRDEFFLDAIVHLVSPYGEAEAHVNELTPVYTGVIKLQEGNGLY